MEGLHRRRATCRGCESSELETVLELGPQPLANAFLRRREEFEREPRFPLDVCVCRRCWLVQTPDRIDPAVLFRDYVYRTGVSASMNEHLRGQARAIVERVGFGREDLVIEIASNDGTLLKHFQAHGVKTLGIEPARKIAAEAHAAGVETLDLFFDAQSAATIRERRGPARVVVANNVLAHVDDTIAFLRGARTLLDPDRGHLIVEVPSLRELLARLEYDTIYHEHLCYFGVHSLVTACENAGFEVAGIERLPVHGGSLRLHATLSRSDRPADRAAGRRSAAVATLLDEDRGAGLQDLQTYRRFADRVRAHRVALVGFLEKLRREGATIAAYGAPAKGNTLLNWCRIGTQLVEYAVDRNPDKVGCFTPGMHLPILPVATLLERQPGFVLLLAWNLRDEIVAQEREYLRRGGRLILPVPEPRIVSLDGAGGSR